MRVTMLPQPAATTTLPGPEFPPVPPNNPQLPNPVPSLAQLEQLALHASPRYRFTPGSPPSSMHNAHYGNTRTQLAYALAGPYNSVEGDVRMRDGIPVMQHDRNHPHDLTFEQWATLMATAGRHMRIDMKEHETLAPVIEIVERLHVPQGSMTFNVGAGLPGTPANESAATIRALRARFPGSWFSINIPIPFGPVYELAAHIGRTIGGERLGITVTAGYVSARDVRKLRSVFEYVNAWNIPQFKPIDIASETTRLRAMGVNGMIDLRRADDPYAED
jgi:hypothetical protein